MSEAQAQQMLQQMQMLENMYAELSQKENSINNIIRDADSAIKSIQEIKANPEQFDESIFTDLGYHCFWNPAEKKGYSGVAILTKTKPAHLKPF